MSSTATGGGPRAPVVTGYSDLVEVGRGGFAIVYRAHQSAFDRVVALKVIARIDLDETVIRRFQQECRAMGVLSWHPHIVVVFDAVQTESGLPYLAMEYLSEGSLADRLLGFSLPPSSHVHLPHWYGYKGSAVARAIIDAGWKAHNVDLKAETLTLTRNTGNAKVIAR